MVAPWDIELIMEHESSGYVLLSRATHQKTYESPHLFGTMLKQIPTEVNSLHKTLQSPSFGRFVLLSWMMQGHMYIVFLYNSIHLLD